jgi:16S rRNA (guanine527-N7)-methyltransferase
MPDDNELRRVLTELQRRGAIGPVDIDAAIEHAVDFVSALPDATRLVVDLGSGGGLPGLVIAARRRDVELVLVERRAKRADLLRFAVRALDVADRVVVTETDATRVADSLAITADAVTARSFGAPGVVMPIAASLLLPGGFLLVSDPPDRMSRWSPDELAAWGFEEYDHVGGVRRLRRR